MSKSIADQGVPISVKIRERVKAAKQRFHANDNIAEFIQPGELEALLDEVEDKMRLVHHSGFNSDSSHVMVQSHGINLHIWQR